MTRGPKTLDPAHTHLVRGGSVMLQPTLAQTAVISL